MAVAQMPDLAVQIEKIRAAVARDGHMRVNSNDLSLLTEGVSQTGRILSVAKIAQWEGWGFEFEQDGAVRFSRLQRLDS